MPVLDVRIFGPTGKGRKIEMIVDTGSAYHAVPFGLAEDLGLLSTGFEASVMGAGGTLLEGRICRARLSFIDDRYDADVPVLRDNIGTLAHHDFLARRRTIFDTGNGYFILERPT